MSSRYEYSQVSATGVVDNDNASLDLYASPGATMYLYIERLNISVYEAAAGAGATVARGSGAAVARGTAGCGFGASVVLATGVSFLTAAAGSAFGFSLSGLAFSKASSIVLFSPAGLAFSSVTICPTRP